MANIEWTDKSIRSASMALRDREFEIVNDCPDDEAWFRLEADDDTLALFPRRFRLEIGYSLQGERLNVMWRVSNLDEKPMAFQIGAHPAFNYPDFSVSDSVHAYLCLISAASLPSGLPKKAV